MSVRIAPGSMPGRYHDRSEPPAPHQEAAYRCIRGHDFAVILAAAAEPPPTWDYCCCGASGQRVPGGKEDADASASEHARRLAQLRERRSPAELEQILADRLAELAALRRAAQP